MSSRSSSAMTWPLTPVTVVEIPAANVARATRSPMPPRPPRSYGSFCPVAQASEVVGRAQRRGWRDLLPHRGRRGVAPDRRRVRPLGAEVGDAGLPGVRARSGGAHKVRTLVD